jgi:hypothetical protein
LQDAENFFFRIGWYDKKILNMGEKIATRALDTCDRGHQF